MLLNRLLDNIVVFRLAIGLSRANASTMTTYLRERKLNLLPTDPVVIVDVFRFDFGI